MYLTSCDFSTNKLSSLSRTFSITFFQIYKLRSLYICYFFHIFFFMAKVHKRKANNTYFTSTLSLFIFLAFIFINHRSNKEGGFQKKIMYVYSVISAAPSMVVVATYAP